MIRCLLILPLMALLLPGKNYIGDNWGCVAFQHHRRPVSTGNGYSTGFDQHAPRIRVSNDAIGAATPNTNYIWSNARNVRFHSSRMAAGESESDNSDDNAEAEKIKERKVKAEAKQASAEAEAKRLKVEAKKAAKLKAEQDEKLKEAREMLAVLQAEAEARKKTEEETAKQQADAEEKQKQAEEETAKLKAEAEAEEEKKRLKAKKKAEEEAARLKTEAEEEKQRLNAKKKADGLATLLKAKEEAARVMAEIDAKLQAETAQADEEEAERVQKLQADAVDMPDLDDESDEMLKKMMEEMEKVKIELDKRVEAEAKEAAARAKAEDEVLSKKAKENTAAKAKAEEQTNAVEDLMDSIKSGANSDPGLKTVAVEQVGEIPPSSSKPKVEPIDTTATSRTPQKSMPDLSSSSKGKPKAKKKSETEDSKPKWMVDWNKDEKAKGDDEAKAKRSRNDKSEEKEDEEDAESVNTKSDPRTKGRSKKENLFDVIGRTATGGITMDEITKKKKKEPRSTKKAAPAEVVNKVKKEGPPESFGKSVAASYRTGDDGNKEPRRAMPDLQKMEELKKKGPPASFGSFAKAASGSGSSLNGGSDSIGSEDKGPPASFGASVAMASSGDVPQDLLSRGTASTDASSPPPKKSTTSKKRGTNSNIIDVVDVEYTKKDTVIKAKQKDPIASAPPLQVEKTVPQAPPLQVEKTVAPMKNPSKKKEDSNTVAENKAPPTDNSIKNIGKVGQKKKDPEEDADDKKVGGENEMAMEDRVAELLKEAFSLSKEDSRVADLLQGVVSITTGKEDKKKKREKRSVEKTSSKGRTRASKVAVKEEIEDEEDDYDDDYVDDDEASLDDDDGEEEEDPVIMGRNRRMEDRNDFGRNSNRRGPLNREMGNRRSIEDTRRPDPFGDPDNDGYFVDDDDEYFEYDDNDRFRDRGPGSRRSEPPMQSGRYSVRPPPQSRGEPRFETDDDYYFLQYGSPGSRGSPSSRYDEPRGNNYDDNRGDYYNDDEDDYDGPQPGAPRPAYFNKDDVPKGPPSSFGNFVADASMSKTGYAPSSLKDDGFRGGGDIDSGINGNSGGTGGTGEEWADEMSQATGSMYSPRGVKVNGSGGKAASSQDPFVVSEDQSDNGGRKKGPPSSFGNSVASAGEQQTGFSTRSIEEEIASGGMATPTGGMASPKRKTPDPTAGGEKPAGQGKKKPLFVVSEEDAGPADFGTSVAEASGSRTGWAPKIPTRPTGNIEGGTTGGFGPKISKQKPSSPQSSTPQKKAFGSTVFDDCPPIDSKKQKKPQDDLPLSRKVKGDTDLNQKHQRNPAVNLVDGGASKNPPKQVRFNGSMMAPRMRRKEPPATPPPEIEGDSLEDKEDKK